VAAWNTFLEVYARLVYSHCRRLQGADADDICQEVFVRVSQSIGEFDYQPEKGRFRNWLGTIVRNEINRFFRKRNRPGVANGTGMDDLLNQVESPPETVWNDDFQRHILAAALQRIRPHFQDHTWAMFERVWLAGAAAPQVAREVGLPIARVYEAKSKVLKRLRVEISVLTDEVPFFDSV
jgi:RNA polymerase sigma-70 factor (ECF subfamily)